MLCTQAGVPKERGDDMIACDVSFNPLRVKGASGRYKKKGRLTPMMRTVRARATGCTSSSAAATDLKCLQGAIKGLKKILKTLSPHSKMPKLYKKDAQCLSFLSRLEDEGSSEFGDNYNEATS
ncbi:hypothetical protein HAX54_022719 [Datura stramonium]|uniref:Uncharacterized protein n=1 Tax=Datura stramonium TaxID=4076 RepID=A0ABS8UWX1_DATST|nr:hypothetical protein [Datura stramonium]